MITLRKLASLPVATRKRKLVRLLYQIEVSLRHDGGHPGDRRERPNEASGHPGDRPNETSGHPGDRREWPNMRGNPRVAVDMSYNRGLAELAAACADRPTTEEAAHRLRQAVEGDRPGARAASQYPVRVGERELFSGSDSPSAALLRALNTLRHALMTEIGAEPAEWDLLPELGVHADAVRATGLEVFVDDVRSPFNVGSIVRTCAAFGVERVVLSESCPGIETARARRSAMGAERFVEVIRGTQPAEDRTLFALEQGGTPLGSFVFPVRGVVIVGSEELGVRPELLRRADGSAGRVSIPLPGAKSSLNVGVALGILLNAWTSFRDHGVEVRKNSATAGLTPD